MTNLPVKPGIDGIPTGLIPTDPDAFVDWFKNSFLPRWAANADARNAVPTSASVLITGDTNTPAGIGIGPNSITNGELVQRSPLSVMGNPTGVEANVLDIKATADGQSLQRVAGVLVWAPAVPTITTADSITGLGSVASPLELVGDSLAPGSSLYYGTNASGTKGFFPSTGITVVPTDREFGPTAGPGAGNNALFLGSNAGLGSTVNQIIVLGSESAKGGITDTHLAGTTIVGAGDAGALTGPTGFVPAFSAANTILGSNNVPVLKIMDTTVIVGSSNYPLFGGATSGNLSQSVIIGNANYPLANNIGNAQRKIIIGHNNFTTVIFPNTGSLTCIGNSSGNGGGTINNVNNSQMIGNAISTGTISSTSNACTLIGDQIVQPASVINHIQIGFQSTTASVTSGCNTLLGVTTSSKGDLNTLLGFKATTTTVGVGCSVVIGANATTAITNAFLVGCSTTLGGGNGNTASNLMFGSFLTGNILFGTSVAGTNQDFGGTGTSALNVVKLLNGAKSTGGNPVGGGYFYVSAGALHWVGSSGTDTVVAVA